VNRSLLLTLLIVSAACGGADAADRDDVARAIPVRVVHPEFRRALPPITLTGTLGAKEEVPLAFKIGGVVTRVAVEAGQVVREGDLLAELSLTEIDGQVSAAREGLAKARRDVARAERLHADSVVTLAQLEDARTGLEVAEAQAKAAEFNRRYAVIRAPASGVVLTRRLEAGQVVGPGIPVLVLRTERKGLVLRAAAADRDAVRIAVGERATLTFDAFPGDEFGGTVERVGVAASPVTGTYEVEISLAPTDRRFVSGLIGEARLLPRGTTALPFIPAEALLEVDGANASIFVLGDDGRTVRRRRVRVAFLDHGFAALGGPMDPTVQVVTAGATRLSEGSPVTVVPARTP
jgi:membrane fusion protein, multidrug efflux system